MSVLAAELTLVWACDPDWEGGPMSCSPAPTPSRSLHSWDQESVRAPHESLSPHARLSSDARLRFPVRKRRLGQRAGAEELEFSPTDCLSGGIVSVIRTNCCSKSLGELGEQRFVKVKAVQTHLERI